MDFELDATMNEILKKENVTGAMFVDKNGLAITGSLLIFNSFLIR
jgi:hypothetical protein